MLQSTPALATADQSSPDPGDDAGADPGAEAAVDEPATETAAPSAPAPEGPLRRIDSRVGVVETPEANLLHFPRGLLGFEKGGDYAVLTLPHAGMEQFKLLQSCDDVTAGFIVTEAAAVADALDPKDLQEAYRQCEVKAENALTLLIVNVRRSDDGIELSANLRAPVVIDMSRRVGRQHVMANGKYAVRFTL